MPTRPWTKRAALLVPLAAALGALVAVTILLLRDNHVYDLRWRLQAGQVLTVESSSRSTFTASDSQDESTGKLKVLSVDALGNAELELVTEHVKHREVRPQGTVDYDSNRDARPPDDRFARMSAEGLHAPLHFRMDPRGCATQLQDVEAAQKKSMEHVKDMDFLGIFSKMRWSGPGNPVIPVQFPSRPVRAGESWTQESRTDHPLFGTTINRQEFTLQEVKNGIARIEIRGMEPTRIPGPVDKALDQMGPKKPPSSPDPVHRQSGTILFSLDRGIVLSWRLDIRVESRSSNGKPFGFASVFDTRLTESK